MTRRGLRRVGRFDGRDTAAEFWPYVGGVLAVVMASGFIMNAILIVRIGRADDTSQAGADLAAATAVWAAMAGGVVVVLLAAAVTRRLHDSDHRGAWGLLPVPFLAGGVYLTPRAVDFSTDDSPTPEFVVLVANNAVYVALVALLVWKLTRPTDATANRFGPPPG